MRNTNDTRAYTVLTTTTNDRDGRPNTITERWSGGGEWNGFVGGADERERKKTCTIYGAMCACVRTLTRRTYVCVWRYFKRTVAALERRVARGSTTAAATRSAVVRRRRQALVCVCVGCPEWREGTVVVVVSMRVAAARPGGTEGKPSTTTTTTLPPTPPPPSIGVAARCAAFFRLLLLLLVRQTRRL